MGLLEEGREESTQRAFRGVDPQSPEFSEEEMREREAEADVRRI